MKQRILLGLFLLTSTLYAGDLPSSTQGIDAQGLVNPSSRFEVDNGWNFFLNTEFLWWVAKEDGLYYAQAGYTGVETSAVPPTGEQNFNGMMKKIHPIFRPGFRVSFGGNMHYDEWDVLLGWTWFKNHTRNAYTSPALTLWGHPETTGNGGNGSNFSQAEWSLHYNVIDSELGRAFWVGKHLSAHPFFGIRGSWISQHLDVLYNYQTAIQTVGDIRADSNFQGVGARGGLDLRFTLLGSWSIYGIASASMLYGYYKCNFRELWESLLIAKARDSFRRSATTVQLVLGVRWDTYLHKDRYHFGFYAAWEQNVWFGINKMNHFFGNLSEGNLQQMNGDLSLAGGTLGVRFDF